MSTLTKFITRSPPTPGVASAVQPVRNLSSSRCARMPYKPEERLPLTEHQKRLYPQVEQKFTDEGYPLLKLKPSGRNMFAPRYVRPPWNGGWSASLKPRELSMPENQDWPSVWSTARTFAPSAVPMPIRQSFEEKKNTPSLGKHNNTELTKIPNFLHLSPSAIERQCRAISKFCTPWPKELRDDADRDTLFPITYIQSDYVHSSPNIREPKSRVVTLKVHTDSLQLSPHDLDKLRRLARHRFDASTGVLTITAKECPSRVQNKDYTDYLLTALYFESKRHEPWEADKPECDWERFFWERSESKEKAKQYLRQAAGQQVSDEVIEKGEGNEVVEGYRESLEKVYNNETVETLNEYRLSVEKLYGLGCGNTNDNKVSAQ